MLVKASRERTMRLSNRSPVNRLRHLLAAHDLDALPDAALARAICRRPRRGGVRNARPPAQSPRLRHRPTRVGQYSRRRRRIPGGVPDPLPQGRRHSMRRDAVSVAVQGDISDRPFDSASGRDQLSRSSNQPPNATSDPLTQISGRELCSVIDAKLRAFRTGLRSAIVLCCFQGLTRDEAAAQLGWSSATVKRRLARARELLDRRLRARGSVCRRRWLRR